MEIILVCGNKNPEIANKRLAAAIAHFRRNPAEFYSEYFASWQITRYLLLSGGSAPGKPKSETAVMRENAIKGGIDAKFILIEEMSRNTVENMLYSKKLLENMKNIANCQNILTITVCTSSFHIKRAFTIAKFLFTNCAVNFIHTNETVTPAEKNHEDVLLNTTIDNFMNSAVT